MNKKENTFDVVVIGAGSGGLNIAVFMQKAGFRVLLVDKSDKSIGGDCLNFGCVPSKALIHIARTVQHSKEASEYGILSSGEIDIKKVTDYIDSKKEHIREHENAEYFRKMGMTVVLGSAHFVSEDAIEVDGVRYKGKKTVLATGSRPRKLSLPGIENAKIYNNENIFDIDFLPKRFVFIGGGPIGVELGQAFSQLGSEVSIVNRGEVILPAEDKEVSEVVLGQLKSEGISFNFSVTPLRIENGSSLIVKNKEESEENIEFDALFTGIGRELNIENLGLEKAKIEVRNGKIVVDDRLRTTNKKVFLCGDVAGGHQFTHAAELHAKVILNNFFSPFKKKLNKDDMAWVTYTTPEVATFGVSEKELQKRNIKYNVVKESFSEEDRAIVDNTTNGFLKLFLSKKGYVLGGTMVAVNAGELIQELILLRSAKLPLSTLFNKVYPYPTATRINKRIASKAEAGKLTPTAKKILKLLY